MHRGQVNDSVVESGTYKDGRRGSCRPWQRKKEGEAGGWQTKVIKLVTLGGIGAGRTKCQQGWSSWRALSSCRYLCAVTRSQRYKHTQASYVWSPARRPRSDTWNSNKG